ncbi:MAG: hypothetical protein NZ561_02175 [Phycisphaerae bacterium]|nr:hypothetical protein [Phycisphaerae bacterium]
MTPQRGQIEASGNLWPLATWIGGQVLAFLTVEQWQAGAEPLGKGPSELWGVTAAQYLLLSILFVRLLRTWHDTLLVGCSAAPFLALAANRVGSLEEFCKALLLLGLWIAALRLWVGERPGRSLRRLGPAAASLALLGTPVLAYLQTEFGDPSAEPGWFLRAWPLVPAAGRSSDQFLPPLDKLGLPLVVGAFGAVWHWLSSRRAERESDPRSM